VSFQKSVKEGNHCTPTHQPTKRPEFANPRRHWLLPPPSQILPVSSFWMDKRSTFLEKSANEAWKQRRRWAAARGQVADNLTHPGLMRTGTRSDAATGSARVPARWQQRGTRRWAPDRGEAVVEWTQCQRRGSSTRSSQIPMRGQAAARRSVSVRGQRIGRGECLTFVSTSVWQLRRGVEEAAKV
jgi:hypothetical protein